MFYMFYKLYKLDPVNVLMKLLSLSSFVTSQENVLQREVYVIASGCSINIFSTFNPQLPQFM